MHRRTTTKGRKIEKKWWNESMRMMLRGGKKMRNKECAISNAVFMPKAGRRCGPERWGYTRVRYRPLLTRSDRWQYLLI